MKTRVFACTSDKWMIGTTDANCQLAEPEKVESSPVLTCASQNAELRSETRKMRSTMDARSA